MVSPRFSDADVKLADAEDVSSHANTTIKGTDTANIAAIKR
jgi:hypothetical protein